MRNSSPGSRLVPIFVGLALISSGFGQAEFGVAFVDPLLGRLMRASDQAASDTGQPEAIPPDEIAFYARQAVIDESTGVPAVRVRLALDTTARQAIEDLGIRTYGRLDGFASALVPVTQLQSVASIPGVEQLQAMRIPKMEIDVSRGEVRSTQVETTYGSRGRGVILGSIDSGIDWRHDDFRNANGTTRIKYIWSQDDACVGTRPPYPFDFGCLYTEADINAALAGGPAITAPDADGHGTHTIGVAAGNGRGTDMGLPAQRYTGMAPEADIIVVKTFPEPTDTNGCATCYDVSAGMDFIDAKAAELGEPYVINISLGSQYGGHDGSDLDERTIDTLVGSGKPGKAIVKSAGNDRGHAIHIGGTLVAGQTNTHNLVIPAYTPLAGAFNDAVAWSVWYNNGDNLTVTIADPTTSPCGSTTLTLSATTGQGLVSSSTSSGTMLIDDSSSPAPNGGRFFDMEVDDQASFAPCRGTWQLRVRGNTITAGGRYDAWIWFSSFGSTHLESLWTTPENARVISVPGTAFNVTTVGAYISKYDWLSRDGATYHFVGTVATDVGKLTSFSSPGPTRDGRIKPDIDAPGSAIVSTLSQNVTQDASIIPLVVPDTVHWALPGTSFAAPHVAGVYAQLLALKPNLDAIQLRTLVTTTARVDANVPLPVPNNNWGSGKLDGLGAAQAACPAEVCDGLDNDCDGVADDGFDVGQGCAVGVGACRASGVVICAAGGAGTTCGATPGEPGAEVCDGIDNDCDGAVDEEYLPVACTTGLPGVCSAGVSSCDAGGEVCHQTTQSGAEICDGLDNDCDGAADDDLGATTCGIGECRQTTQNCVAGEPQTCVPDPPGIESCNGLDDDCDGIADADPAGQPLTEICYTGPAGTSGVGQCRAGFAACTAGSYGTCVGEVTPTTESCNGLDDNCDGTSDEGGSPLVAVVTPAAGVLWPPNHRMTAVHVDVTATGGCLAPGSTLNAILTSVTSSEVDDAPGGGDGNTIGDIQGAGSGTADFDVDVRAERDGTGTGRLYALTYAVSDSAGDMVTATGLVFVPRDQRGADEPTLVSLTQGDAGTAAMWDEAPGAMIYTVVRGEIANLRETDNTIDLGPVTCIHAGPAVLSTVGHEDPEDPALGHAFFYLVAYDDGWGSSGYGTASAPKPRVVAAGDCR